MKPYEKFLSHSSLMREILDNYLELRLHLQEEGFSQKDLERVVRPTHQMMSLREKFIYKKNDLYTQIRDYGFDISQKELEDYIQPLSNKIDELTPLNNGNN